MIVIGTDLTSQHREIVTKFKISGIFVEYRKDLYFNTVKIYLTNDQLPNYFIHLNMKSM